MIINIVFPLILSEIFVNAFFSKHFLVSKVLIWEVIRFFQMVFPKAVCILFQVLTALIVIEFCQYKLLRNEGLNNLPVEKAAVLLLCISEQSVNHLSKIKGNILLKYLLTSSTFSSWILSSNLSKFWFLNRGLIMAISWLKTNSSQGLFLQDRHSIHSIGILSPNHMRIINMGVKDCIIDSFQCVDIDEIRDLKKESIFSIQFYCNIRNMVFPVQIFINSNTKIFNRICGIESFSVNLNCTV